MKGNKVNRIDPILEQYDGKVVRVTIANRRPSNETLVARRSVRDGDATPRTMEGKSGGTLPHRPRPADPTMML